MVENQKKMNLKLIVVVALFFYNAFKFLTAKGSELPIPSILFNLIIFLGLIIFFLHKEQLNKKAFQAKLEDYFKKEK